MCVCLCVCYRCPNRWGYGAEFWHRAEVPPGEGHSNHSGQLPPPPGRGPLKTGSQGPRSPNGEFLGKVYKTKVEQRPQFSVGGSGQIWRWTSPRGPAEGTSARERPAAMVPWPIGLKLGRTWLQRCIGTINLPLGNLLPDCSGKRVRAPKGPYHVKYRNSVNLSPARPETSSIKI